MVTNIKNELNIVTKSGSYDGIVRIVAFFITFLANIILARITDPTSIGVIAVTISILSILQILPQMGLGLIILQRVPVHLVQKEFPDAINLILRSCLICLIASLFFVLVYFIFLQDLIGTFFQRSTGSLKVFNIFMWFFPVICLFPFLQAIFTSLQKTYKSSFYDQIVRNLFRVLFTVSCIFFFTKLTSLIIGTILGLLVSFLLQSLDIVKEFKKLKADKTIFHFSLRWSDSKPLLNKSLPLILVPILSIASREIDLWITGFYLSSNDSGIYAIIRIIGSLILIPLMMFGDIFVISTNKLLNENKINEANKFYSISVKWIGIIIGLGFVLVAGLSKDVLNIFGQSYTTGSTALIIFIFGQLILSYFGATGTLLLLRNKKRLLVINGLLQLSLVVTLGILLTPKYGIAGSAIAICTAYFITQIVILCEVRYFLKIIPITLPDFLRRSGIIIVSLAVLYLLSGITENMHYFYRLIIISLLISIIYLLMVYFTEKWKEEEKQLLRAILLKLFPQRLK